MYLPKAIANESKNKLKGDFKMEVLGINKILNWCQITTGVGTYTCKTKEIDGKLQFKFKRAWHPIENFVSEKTIELVKEGGTVFSRPFSK
jgi:hypothetical protein